jgi:hypothetical protein
MIFDETLVPGGSLSNAILEFDWDRPQDPTIPASLVASYKVRSEAGTFIGSLLSDNFELDWTDLGLLQTSGWLHNLFGSSVMSGYYRITFDSVGDVLRWGGGNSQGGSNDPGSYGDLEEGIGSDGTWFSYSPGPGTWTRTALVADLPQVPLPAGAALLGGALVALSLIRRRRPHGTA